jgi:hypothetical protein
MVPALGKSREERDPQLECIVASSRIRIKSGTELFFIFPTNLAI